MLTQPVTKEALPKIIDHRRTGWDVQFNAGRTVGKPIAVGYRDGDKVEIFNSGEVVYTYPEECSYGEWVASSV